MSTHFPLPEQGACAKLVVGHHGLDEASHDLVSATIANALSEIITTPEGWLDILEYGDAIIDNAVKEIVAERREIEPDDENEAFETIIRALIPLVSDADVIDAILLDSRIIAVNAGKLVRELLLSRAEVDGDQATMDALDRPFFSAAEWAAYKGLPPPPDDDDPEPDNDPPRARAQEQVGQQGAEDAQASGSQGRADPLAGFRFDGDAENDEPPPMLVKKLVELMGICFIGGQSGAGKTFIAIYLAVCLASQEPFFGHKITESVGVAVMAAEGAATIGHRVTVARNAKAAGEPLPIAWLGAVPNLADAKEVKALLGRLRALDARFRETHCVRLGAVILDTLAASFSLNDENDNSEAAKAIRAMSIMSRALGVVIIPVHHFGKATETGLRGASAWRAGCDTVLSVLADRDQTTGQCSNRRVALTKSRVGEEGWNTSFELRFVKLGEDDDGDEYGACYVEPGRTEDVIITVKEKGPPRHAKVFINALGIVIGDKGRKVRPFGSDGSEVTAVDREAIRGEFYRLWAADGETDEARASAQRKAFKRGEDWALDHGLAASYGDGKQHMVWLLKRDGQ